jgi:hypothetical protein
LGKLTFLILFLLTGFAYAQFENTDVGARAVSLNGAFTSLSDNSLAVFYNPAGLGQMKFREISAFYSPAPFGLSDLSTAALSYAEPVKFGVIGAGIKSYGFDLYRETNILFSYGNNYSGRLFYGANINFYHLNIQNYNSASSFGLDIGAMAYLTSFLKWGFFGKNITSSSIGRTKEKIAQVYRTGFTYQPVDILNLILEAEKDVKYPVSVRAGFEYSIIDYVDLRAGVGSEPTLFSAGVGINYSLIRFDYAFSKSEDLGFTHQGTITVNFGGLKGKKDSRQSLKRAFG